MSQQPTEEPESRAEGLARFRAWQEIACLWSITSEYLEAFHRTEHHRWNKPDDNCQGCPLGE